MLIKLDVMPNKRKFMPIKKADEADKTSFYAD